MEHRGVERGKRVSHHPWFCPLSTRGSDSGDVSSSATIHHTRYRSEIMSSQRRRGPTICIFALCCWTLTHGLTLCPLPGFQEASSSAWGRRGSPPSQKFSKFSTFKNPPKQRTQFALQAAPEDHVGEGATRKSKNVRLQVFSTLNLPIVEVFSFLAVLLSSFLVALNTLNDLPPVAYAAIDDALLVINILFTLDFFVRWYAAGQFKAIYLSKPLVVLDIIVVLVPLILGSAMLPMLDYMGLNQGEAFTLLYGLQNSAGLQNLLLLRVLRLRRVLTDINTFGKFAVTLGLKPQVVRPYQLQLARVLLSIFTLLSVATGLIYTAEHDVNPDIPDYFSALYFGLTTLTTVGLGDIAPITPQGRLIVCGSILFGIAIIPAQTAKLVDIFVESQKDQQDRRKKRSKAGDSTSTKVIGSAQSATDGKGPSGVAIEIPPQDKSLGESSLGGRRVCGQCSVSSHRADASFCWSCGSEL